MKSRWSIERKSKNLPPWPSIEDKENCQENCPPCSVEISDLDRIVALDKAIALWSQEIKDIMAVVERIDNSVQSLREEVENISMSIIHLTNP